jgi:hypothetical protein
VEVHEPTRLELSDLRIGHTDTLAPLALAESGAAGERPDQLDHEPVPQRRGMPIPQHRTLIVVGVGVDRGAQSGSPASWRRPHRHGRLSSGRLWTAPNDGAVRLAKTCGCSATCSGTPLRPPAIPAYTSCHMSPRYSCAHDGHCASRRLPQRTISAPSGSLAVEYTGSSPRSTTPRNRTGWRHAPVRLTCCSQRSR